MAQCLRPYIVCCKTVEVVKAAFTGPQCFKERPGRYRVTLPEFHYPCKAIKIRHLIHMHYSPNNGCSTAASTFK